VRLRLLAAIVALASCGDTRNEPAARTCTDVRLLVAASDYSSSLVCGAPGCTAGPGTTGADLGKDPQLAQTNGRTFLLARDNDLLFELDSGCGTPIAKTSVHDAATSATANPHDVAAAADGTLFVVLYNAPKIALLRDGRVSGEMDLSPFDGDGNPQAESIRIVPVNGVPKGFVTLERLDDRDRLLSKQPSQMLRIDVASRKVETAIDLAGRNPFNAMSEDGGALFLAEPGNFDAADDALAGIERFDTATSTSKLLVTERDLGASVAEVAVAGGCGVAIVAGPQKDVNPTSLVVFEAETGRLVAPPTAPLLGPTPGYDLQGLAWRGSELYVGDRRRGEAGYRVHTFEREGQSCVLRPSGRTIDLPQPPVALRAASAT
jgi:hypothetical protein